MPKIFYYNVYENDTLVLECVTAKEIAAKLNYAKQYVQKCIMNETKLGNIYSITYVTDNSAEAKEKNYQYKTFPEEWEAAVKPFRGVRWSKHRGRKLIVNK